MPAATLNVVGDLHLPRRDLHQLSSLWFVWAELFRVNAICLWCTVVHILTLALLGAVLGTTTGQLDASRTR